MCVNICASIGFVLHPVFVCLRVGIYTHMQIEEIGKTVGKIK